MIHLATGQRNQAGNDVKSSSLLITLQRGCTGSWGRYDLDGILAGNLHAIIPTFCARCDSVTRSQNLGGNPMNCPGLVLSMPHRKGFRPSAINLAKRPWLRGRLQGQT